MALLRRKTKEQALAHGEHFEPEWDVPERFNFTRDVMEEHGKDLLKPALTFVDREGIVDRRTFREVAGDAARWAHLLRTRLDRGDRVALAIGRVPSWHLAMLGALKSGVVAVPCSDLLRARDLAFRVHHSGARLLVADRSLEVEIEEMRHQVGASVSVLYLDEALEELRRYMPVAPSEDTTAGETALILYTSGTTQEPKGAVHTHAYTWAQRTQATHWLDAHEGDVVWCTAGPGSAKAVWNSLLGPWSHGAEIVIHESPFEATERLSLVQRLGVTILCQTPTEYRMLAKLEKLELAHLPRLRHAVSAGEPLNPEVIARFQDALGLTVYDGYGQTENALLVANTPAAPLRPGSMGQPTPGHDIAVIDDVGNVCPPGVEGDLALMGRPPTLFSGYWEAPDETDALFRDGWFLTGDRATRDEDGYLWFVGRSDDVIVSAAYRIGPFEVESALLEHPSVAESAVVGVPDVDRGQIVKAFVVLRPGQEPSDRLVTELQEHVKAVTAPYKYPREIAFVEELPKTASGKIQRAELRKLHAELAAAPPPALSIVPDPDEAPDPAATEAAERARREAELAARRDAVERTRLAAAAAAAAAAERATIQARGATDPGQERDPDEAAATAAAADAAAHARIEAEQRARANADEAARREAEDAARLEAEAVARARAEAEAEEAARVAATAEAAERARLDAEERARADAEMAAQREAEETARRTAEAEAAERARAEAEVAARREAEDTARRAAEAEAAERARIEAEQRARAEAEETARREAEETARRAAEAAERARAEAEEAARREAEDTARRAAEAEAAERARLEAEQRARAEAAAAARREAEDTARRAAEAEAAERTRIEAEERARAEAEETTRREAEETARRAAEAAERARAEAEEAAQREAEDTARRAAEAEAAEHARIEAEQRARAEAEMAARREAEEIARRAAEAEAAERARAEAEEAVQRDAEEAARRAAEAEAAEHARIEAEQRARAEAEMAARREAEEAAAVAALAVEPDLLDEIDVGEASVEGEKESRGDARRRKREEKEAAKQHAEEERRQAKAAEEQLKRDEAAAREDAKRREAEEKEAAKRREIEAKEAAKREAEDAKRREIEAKEAAKRGAEDAKRREIEAKEAAKREAEDAKRREAEEKEAAKRQAEEARVQAKLDAEQRKRDEAAAREAEKVAAKQREEDERRRQAEEREAAKRREEEERRRLREEEKARRGGGLGRLFKREELDDLDDADDGAPVEPISDIVERLRFYSRTPEPTIGAPNGSDEATVEDQSSSSQTIEAD